MLTENPVHIPLTSFNINAITRDLEKFWKLFFSSCNKPIKVSELMRRLNLALNIESALAAEKD